LDIQIIVMTETVTVQYLYADQTAFYTGRVQQKQLCF
jgi:hypothetical protein